MKPKLLVPLLLAFALSAFVWTAADGAGPAVADPAPLLPNTCSISCPAGTAYVGLSGDVGCQEGFAPVCQCTIEAEPMASCEAVEP